jgi:hypothetical protein
MYRYKLTEEGKKWCESITFGNANGTLYWMSFFRDSYKFNLA